MYVFIEVFLLGAALNALKIISVHNYIKLNIWRKITDIDGWISSLWMNDNKNSPQKFQLLEVLFSMSSENWVLFNSMHGYSFLVHNMII